MINLPLRDASGLVAKNVATARANLNIMPYASFEKLGSGGADVFAGWLEQVANGGTIEAETTVIHGGYYACKITGGTSGISMVYENVTGIIPGRSYVFSFWTQGDGSYGGRYAIYDNTNSGYIKAATDTGVTGAAYAQVTFPFTAPAGCLSIQIQFRCSTTASKVTYFADTSLSSSVADASVFDGTYGNAVTLGADGATFVGPSNVNSLVTMALPALVNGWPNATGSIIIHGKTTAAAFVDGNSEFLFKFKSASDHLPTLYTDVFKLSTNNTIGGQFQDDTSGAVAKYITFSDTSWFSLGFTWSVANGVQMYFKGLKSGTAEAIGGTRINPMTYTIVSIGRDGDSENSGWIGQLRDFALWDREMTPADMLRVGTL
jgi:hypothetical protein